MIFRPIFFTGLFFLLLNQNSNATIRNRNIGCNTPKKINEIKLSFNYVLTTPLLNPPNISGVLNDSTDAAAIQGIYINIETPLKKNTDIRIKAESDNIEVVRNDNIVFQQNGKAINLKIIPSKNGYANIKVTVYEGSAMGSIDINYACSNNDNFFNKTIWHTGISDASAAISLKNNFMIVADDEKNELCVFNRLSSGLPLQKFEYSKFLNLQDASGDIVKEIDCEATTRSLINPNRVYWLGSMSNGGKSNKIENNRDRLFATDIIDSGSNTTFNFIGYISSLRNTILKWGDANGLDFKKSGAYGTSPKQKNGFNIEGMVFGPDSTTLYICLRAPLAPIERKKSIIIPIMNFENWFNNGKPSSEPIIGEPILLDLGERGIRDIVLMKNKQYIIIAGHCDEIKESSLFLWSGNRNEKIIELSNSNLNKINPEAILEFTDSIGKKYIELISDCGREVYYDDNVIGKYLIPEFKKFRSDFILLP